MTPKQAYANMETHDRPGKIKDETQGEEHGDRVQRDNGGQRERG